MIDRLLAGRRPGVVDLGATLGDRRMPVLGRSGATQREGRRRPGGGDRWLARWRRAVVGPVAASGGWPGGGDRRPAR
jgi:hypothetical protein